MPKNNSQGLSLFGQILAGFAVLVGIHIGLSSLGFIPSEVSEYNQQIKNSVKESIRQLHTIKYTRKGSDKITKTDSKVSANSPSLPEAPDRGEVTGVNPDHLKIPEIDIDVSIKNPTSTEISTLDKALREGVVHYPESGRIGGNRPMFLFGHSSRLPIVQNEAYKSFNGLDELSPGDEIIVSGEGETVRYQVMSVRVVDKDQAYVDFSKDSDILTLSTCSTFGEKENRVVVTARKS